MYIIYGVLPLPLLIKYIKWSCSLCFLVVVCEQTVQGSKYTKTDNVANEGTNHCSRNHRHDLIAVRCYCRLRVRYWNTFFCKFSIGETTGNDTMIIEICFELRVVNDFHFKLIFFFEFKIYFISFQFQHANINFRDTFFQYQFRKKTERFFFRYLGVTLQKELI